MILNGKSTDDFYKRQILANEKLEKMCQNLGASNRTPVQQQTRLETLWTGVKECRKRVVRETTEGHAFFASRLNSIGLLLIINKSIVL